MFNYDNALLCLSFQYFVLYVYIHKKLFSYPRDVALDLHIYNRRYLGLQFLNLR
jgi:hypothetical protein